MNNIISNQTLLNYYNFLQSELLHVQNTLQTLPDKSLHCRLDRGYQRFYTVDTQAGVRKEQYFSVNASEFNDLCKRTYLHRLEKALSAEVFLLKKFLVKYDSDAKYSAYDSLPECIKSKISPVFLSSAEFCLRWENTPVETNPLENTNEGQYRTNKGEFVRSRIELITANILNEMGITYRYECKLELNGRVVYPDFTILSPTSLEEYYLEIFGMMDNPDYSQHCFKKIHSYQLAGLGPRLIPLFDHRAVPLTTDTIKAAIKSVL